MAIGALKINDKTRTGTWLMFHTLGKQITYAELLNLVIVIGNQKYFTNYSGIDLS